MAHPTIVINGVTYTECEAVDIPISGGGTATYHDASQTDAAAGDVLNGKKFVGASGEDTGSMTNNGAVNGTIGTKAGTFSVPAGYTSGGTVSLTNVTDCVAANILSGKSILGVNGSLTTPSISYNSTTHVLSIS